MYIYILHDNNRVKKESPKEPKTTGQKVVRELVILKEFPHRSLADYKGEKGPSQQRNLADST